MTFKVINDVRNKIKTLSKQRAKHEFKFIILDEADSMTKDAMFALRMIMEEYSATTRFCLICNYPYKILKPIVSRCVSLYFPPISEEVIPKLDVEYEPTVEARGDMRRYMLRLQCYGNKIDESFIKEEYRRLWKEMGHRFSLDLVVSILYDAYNLDELLKEWMTLAICQNPRMVSRVATCHHAIVSGCDPFLQLVSLVEHLKKKNVLE